MARLVIFIAALWFGCVAAAADSERWHDFEVAGWSAAVFGDSETGKFANCMAWGEYKNKVSFHIAVYPDYQWALGFTSPDWNIPEAKLNVAYRFDEGQWFVGTVRTTARNFFVLDMPSNSTQVTLFRRSRLMELSSSQGTYYFSLDGTARALSSLAECVRIATSIENGTYVEEPRVRATPQKKAVVKAKPEKTIVAKAKPSGTTVDTDSEPQGSSGTGFIVSKAGHVLTNNHVVRKCAEITVSRTGDVTRPAAILRTDVTNDLAVLKMDTALAADEIARFRTGSMRAGENIATYGFPLAGTLSASGNIVSGNVSSLAGLADDVRLLQISAPIQPGNSGGPLMDYTGAVVGIVNGKLNELAAIEVAGSLPQNVNFSIKANVGMNFLDAHSIPYETSSETAVIDLPAIADKAKKFTVFVSCQR
jgi:S1-C subfamily serine protease